MRFFLFTKISFNAGANSSPSHDAITLVLLSSQILFLIIAFIALYMSSNVIYDRITLFPTTLIVSIGVSLRKFLKALSVVPSPPSVIAKSSLTLDN